ncbi:MAG: hypothetical protein HZC23_05145 [Rhodocyclales bacterium]|nr:hypothetical protein [Rhodocyclales bacterium]
MKPRLSSIAGNDKVLSSIITCISNIKCPKELIELRGPQRDQKEVVKKFQEKVKTRLADKIKTITWQTEVCPGSENGDSVDVYGAGPKCVVAIELDKARADQVSKKFVSRMAILKSNPERTYYISLCYPGTENMNSAECEKYFGYCSKLARRMRSHYAGLIIGPAK